MLKRLFWFTLGVIAGVAGIRYAKDKARGVADGLSIDSLAKDMMEWATKAVNQVEEIVRNLVTADDAKRSERDADVFVSGSSTNDRPGDL
jgi:hypothetical protein